VIDLLYYLISTNIFNASMKYHKSSMKKSVISLTPLDSLSILTAYTSPCSFLHSSPFDSSNEMDAEEGVTEEDEEEEEDDDELS
jgi:hypothetical protein